MQLLFNLSRFKNNLFRLSQFSNKQSKKATKKLRPKTSNSKSKFNFLKFKAFKIDHDIYSVFNLSKSSPDK